MEERRAVKTVPSDASLDAELHEWVALRGRVDSLLDDGVETLVKILDHLSIPMVPSQVNSTREAPRPARLPHLLVTCTLQRLLREKRLARSAETIKRDGPRLLKYAEAQVELDATHATSLKDIVGRLDSSLFGPLNPLTSSETLWVLIRRGEAAAYSPLGVLSLFALLWSLNRRYDNRGAVGARLDPWRPTATVTAKALFAVDAMSRALERREQSYRKIASAVENVEKQNARRVSGRWQIVFGLDEIAHELERLADGSIVEEHCLATAARIVELINRCHGEAESDGFSAPEEIATVYDSVRVEALRAVAVCVADIRKRLNASLRSIGSVLAGVREDLSRVSKRGNALEGIFRCIAEDHRLHAYKTASDVVAACETLVRPVKTRSFSTSKKNAAVVCTALVEASQTIRKILDENTADARRWCLRVVNEQIAFSAAANETWYDTSELLSATAIASAVGLLSSTETETAVGVATHALRRDGSWSSGQPIYLRDGVLGIWPNTPDMFWLLTSACSKIPRARVFDETAQRYVMWLEQNKSTFVRDGMSFAGWSSENAVTADTIETWETATVVNTLLEIRKIIETRILQLAEKLLTVVRAHRPMSGVLPVDLSKGHSLRLHHAMLRNISRVRRGGEGAYGYLFHGPPGTSKTALAESYAAQFSESGWLIRITPADFTAQGEDAIDARARSIFKILLNLRGVTVLFDEIDDLLQRRRARTTAFLQLIVPAMLNRLQDLSDAAGRQEITFILNTNYLERIEPALTRPGRLDEIIAVAYPDVFSRRAIVEIAPGAEVLSEDDVVKLADATPWWPYPLLRRVTSYAALSSVDEALSKFRRHAPELSSHYTRKRRKLKELFPERDALQVALGGINEPDWFAQWCSHDQGQASEPQG